MKLDQAIEAFEWPEQLFYYLNEELANLNRNFLRSSNSSDANLLESIALDADKCALVFSKVFNLLKVCLILSK